MSWRFLKPFLEVIKYQSKRPLPNTIETFKALVDAVVPRTPALSEELESIHSFGALDLHADEYQMWSLNHYLSLNIVIVDFNIYLANTTAKVLDIAARQLIYMEGNKEPINSTITVDECAFSALAQSDRFRAITLLEQLNVDLASLPIPFRNNSGVVLPVIGAVIMLTTIGYYSEWSGYGSTCMETPEKRRLESFPIGWKQIGYPGPSKGYHALRGYLVEKFTD